MPVKLYQLNVSPPARACMMACEIFSVPVQMVDINIMRQEHRTPEFLQLNPIHTIPVLEDGNLVLHDSHAILMYLADAYAEDDSMYPKDTKTRALVNQKLFFNTSILFPRFRNIIYAAVMDGERKLTAKRREDIDEAYSFLDQFLQRTKFLAAEHMTIADLAAVTTVSALVYILPLQAEKYPKTEAWFTEMKKQTFYQKYNAPGAKIGGEWLKNLIEL